MEENGIIKTRHASGFLSVLWPRIREALPVTRAAKGQQRHKKAVFELSVLVTLATSVSAATCRCVRTASVCHAGGPPQAPPVTGF